MILTRLKQETRAEHEAVEQTVDLLSRLGSAGDYRLLLERFLGFYAPMEAQLGALPVWDELAIPIADRMKVPALLCDLDALGMTPGEVAALPRCADLSVIEGAPHALGCLYVLEGATLGGQLIAREAQRALGLTPERGCAFFSSYGKDVGPMWREFRTWLVAAANDEAAEAAIIRGAHETFGSFGRWLTR